MPSLISLPVLSYAALRFYNGKKDRRGLTEKLIDPESGAAASNDQVKYEETITDNSIEVRFACEKDTSRLKIKN